MNNYPHIDGFDDLMSMVEGLGQVPQKVATKSAKKGADVVLREAKALAPEYDGWLKASLKIIGERTKPDKRGSKAYQITFDRAYNSKLVKISKTGKRSYYPVSQEYGWKYGSGGGYGVQYLRNSADGQSYRSQKVMIDTAAAEIDKIIRRYSGDMERSNGRPRGTYRNASRGYMNFR
jgi:hypothetical protein